MEGIMSYFLRFIFGAVFFALRDSERAIAIACLGFFTLGPCLLPLCNIPCLYSSITFFILFFALVALFGFACIDFSCSVWRFLRLLFIFFILFLKLIGRWVHLWTAYCLAEEACLFSARFFSWGYILYTFFLIPSGFGAKCALANALRA